MIMYVTFAEVLAVEPQVSKRSISVASLNSSSVHLQLRAFGRAFVMASHSSNPTQKEVGTSGRRSPGSVAIADDGVRALLEPEGFVVVQIVCRVSVND